MEYTDKYKLSNALMIYENTGGDFSERERYYAEIHNIAFSNNKPYLLAGRTLTNDAMEKISGMFSRNIYKNESMGFLPSRLLSMKNRVSDISLLWWRKAQITQMFFRGVKDGAGRFPCPSLLFLLENQSLQVFALKSKRRPTLKTSVYDTPFPNVYGDGSVCWGNTKRPEKDKNIEKVMDAWERGFFSSEFTSYPETFRNFKDKESFPCGKLKRSKFKTINDIMSRYQL